MSVDDFQLVPPGPSRPIQPIEPLYSMLHDAPLTAVEYLLSDLSGIDTEKALDEVVPTIGVTRKAAIEQVWLVLTQRRPE